MENTKYVTLNDGTRLPTYLLKTVKKGLMQAGRSTGNTIRSRRNKVT